MKRIIGLTIAAAFLLSLAAVVTAGEPAPAKIKNLASEKLAAYGTDPVIVAAVKAANATGQTLDQIKTEDEKWQKTPGIADYMQALMDNDCAKLLHKLQGDLPYLDEVFVMDNQGANVAMSDKTSDYWQGDEAKWQKSYNGGVGAVFVDDVKFDDSTQAYLVQISVPVMDAGKAIGAITFGVDVDKVQ